MSDVIEVKRYNKKEKEDIRYHKHSANRVGGIRGSGNNKFFILFDNDKALVRFEANDSNPAPVRIPVKKATCSGNKKPLPELSVSPLLSYQGGFFASTKQAHQFTSYYVLHDVLSAIDPLKIR